MLTMVSLFFVNQNNMFELSMYDGC